MRYFLMIIMLGVCGIMMAVDFDISQPQDHLNAFMRTRGDASGKDVVYYWTGTVYSFIPGEKRRELFKFEGFNVAKTVVKESGFELLTREAAFFKDPITGEILESWKNPFTGAEVPVVQIWNDPVNQDLDFPAEYLPYIKMMLPSADLGSGLSFYMDIFPFYPSALPRKEFSEFSQSDTYQAAEFFQFFVKKADLANKSLTTVPADISWTRISPWMPFMRMGDREGSLVFVTRGTKLANGWEDMPQQIKDYVEKHNPQYSTAPTEFTEPNETSWTYFRKLWDQGLIK